MHITNIYDVVFILNFIKIELVNFFLQLFELGNTQENRKYITSTQ